MHPGFFDTRYHILDDNNKIIRCTCKQWQTFHASGRGEIIEDYIDKKKIITVFSQLETNGKYFNTVVYDPRLGNDKIFHIRSMTYEQALEAHEDAKAFVYSTMRRATI